jgi:hypothetical protein
VYIHGYTFTYILKVFIQKADHNSRGPKHVVRKLYSCVRQQFACSFVDMKFVTEVDHKPAYTVYKRALVS